MRDFKDLKIAVAGTGYVGLSVATLLAQHHDVTAVDVIPEKVEKNFFDCSAVEAVIDQVAQVNPDAVMVIKSTIPVGFTKEIRMRKGLTNILFSPEFLRESKALYDNLYPSRIIVGCDKQMRRIGMQLKSLPACFRRVQKSRMSRHSSWTIPRQRL